MPEDSKRRKIVLLFNLITGMRRKPARTPRIQRNNIFDEFTLIKLHAPKTAFARHLERVVFLREMVAEILTAFPFSCHLLLHFNHACIMVQA